jgi:uncharacterized lipoprotein YajG
MRKKIAFILSVLLFTGCSDNTTKSNYSTTVTHIKMELYTIVMIQFIF